MNWTKERYVFYLKDVEKRTGCDNPPFDGDRLYDLVQRTETWNGQPTMWQIKGFYSGSSAESLFKLLSRVNRLTRDDFIGQGNWKQTLKEIEQIT